MLKLDTKGNDIDCVEGDTCRWLIQYLEIRDLNRLLQKLTNERGSKKKTCHMNVVHMC
jgi:hypothetical protein